MYTGVYIPELVIIIIFHKVHKSLGFSARKKKQPEFINILNWINFQHFINSAQKKNLLISPYIIIEHPRRENRRKDRNNDEHLDIKGRYTFGHAYHFLRTLSDKKAKEQLYTLDVQWMYRPFELKEIKAIIIIRITRLLMDYGGPPLAILLYVFPIFDLFFLTFWVLSMMDGIIDFAMIINSGPKSLQMFSLITLLFALFFFSLIYFWNNCIMWQ